MHANLRDKRLIRTWRIPLAAPHAVSWTRLNHDVCPSRKNACKSTRQKIYPDVAHFTRYPTVVSCAQPRPVSLPHTGRIVREFLDEGLLDELEIYVMPVLLHEGISLFASPKKAELVCVCVCVCVHPLLCCVPSGTAPLKYEVA